MGQYYQIANIDKQEVLSPDGGSKLMEWGYTLTNMSQTLIQKMLKEWKGDRIFVIGDYAEPDEGCTEIEMAAVSSLVDFLNIKGKMESYEGTAYPVTCYDEISKYKKVDLLEDSLIEGGYLYNHAQKCFVDLSHCPTNWYFYDSETKLSYRNCTSPIVLLLALGNGRGGGDFHSEDENLLNLVGSWTMDMFNDGNNIEFSLEKLSLDQEYTEFNPDFVEPNQSLVAWDDEKNKELMKKAKDEYDEWEKEKKRREQTIHFSKHPYGTGIIATSMKNHKGVILESFKIFNRKSGVVKTIQKLEGQKGSETDIHFDLLNKNGFVNQRTKNLDKNDIFFYKEKREYGGINSYPDCYISDDIFSLKFAYSTIQKNTHNVFIQNVFAICLKTVVGCDNQYYYKESLFPEILSDYELLNAYTKTLDDLKVVTDIDDFKKLSRNCELALEKLQIHKDMVNKLVNEFDSTKEYTEEYILEKVGD